MYIYIYIYIVHQLFGPPKYKCSVDIHCYFLVVFWNHSSAHFDCSGFFMQCS